MAIRGRVRFSFRTVGTDQKVGADGTVNGIVKRSVATTANRSFYFDSSFNHTGFALCQSPIDKPSGTRHSLSIAPI